jgi:UDP-GlcNAc:undecaprenyl-phosphate/decaprenyl-phosphate GlcNAc-1-phosphate transferase
VILYVLCLILSFLLAWYLTPMMREAAIRFQIVDRPDGRLKSQAEPVPYLGGLAVYLAFLVTLALTFTFDRQVLGLLLGGTLVLVLGLIDDFGFLSPYVKLAGQLLAAFVLVKSGIRIEIVYIPDWIELPLSMLWIVGVTNAFNIIDIMDGLASGVGCICALVLFYVALLNDRPVIAIMSISMAGALAAFVRFNFHPARIYLGDAGSLFIGCMLGSLAMIGSYTAQNQVGILTPVIILGVPIFDTAFVSYVRWRRGMRILLGSPDHFALRLRKWRLSTAQTVLCSYALTGLLGISGLVMIHASNLGAALILLLVCGAAWGLGYFLKQIDMTM